MWTARRGEDDPRRELSIPARKLPALWYQVDLGDADIATFFYYLGLASPRQRHPLPSHGPGDHTGLTLFARRFFRELYRPLRRLPSRSSSTTTMRS